MSCPVENFFRAILSQKLNVCHEASLIVGCLTLFLKVQTVQKGHNLEANSFVRENN